MLYSILAELFLMKLFKKSIYHAPRLQIIIEQNNDQSYL